MSISIAARKMKIKLPTVHALWILLGYRLEYYITKRLWAEFGTVRVAFSVIIFPNTVFPLMYDIQQARTVLSTSYPGPHLRFPPRKILFREANRDIFVFVQQVYLSQLVCRSCERKVKNAASVKKTIAETQRLLVKKKCRAKRRTRERFR